jgi:hypothetical protein
MLRNVYFVKYLSLIGYGLIFWGGEGESGNIENTVRDTPLNERCK